MLFELLPGGKDPVAGGLTYLPPWSGPPALETGAVLAVERTAARSANVVVLVPAIRAFRSGCMLDVEVVSRRAACRRHEGHHHRAAPAQDTALRRSAGRAVAVLVAGQQRHARPGAWL